MKPNSTYNGQATVFPVSRFSRNLFTDWSSKHQRTGFKSISNDSFGYPSTRMSLPLLRAISKGFICIAFRIYFTLALLFVGFMSDKCPAYRNRRTLVVGKSLRLDVPLKGSNGVSQTTRGLGIWSIDDCMLCPLIDQRPCCDWSCTHSPPDVHLAQGWYSQIRPPFSTGSSSSIMEPHIL